MSICKVKTSNSWLDASNIFIKSASGIWKPLAALYTKVDGKWVCKNVTPAFPAEPTDYKYQLIGTYTVGMAEADKNWKAPEDGYYQIEVFGASGNGGQGLSYCYPAISGGDPIKAAASGGGGGGGGKATSRVALKKNDTITLFPGKVGDITSATIDSSYDDYYDHTLKVTSGGDGGIPSFDITGVMSGQGIQIREGNGGTKGEASGGNYDNSDGSDGDYGKSSLPASSAPDAGKGGEGAEDGITGGDGGTGYTSSSSNLFGGTWGYHDGDSGNPGYINIYRGNTNVIEQGGSSTSGYSFTVTDQTGKTHTYNFDEGMSWEAFVDSGYNDGSFSFDESVPIMWNGKTYALTSVLTFNKKFILIKEFDYSTPDTSIFAYRISDVDSGKINGSVLIDASLYIDNKRNYSVLHQSDWGAIYYECDPHVCLEYDTLMPAIGDSYTVNITVNNGHLLDYNSAEIYMGTNTANIARSVITVVEANKHWKINISSITGDVVIKIKTIVDENYNNSSGDESNKYYFFDSNRSDNFLFG